MLCHEPSNSNCTTARPYRALHFRAAGAERGQGLNTDRVNLVGSVTARVTPRARKSVTWAGFAGRNVADCPPLNSSSSARPSRGRDSRIKPLVAR
jgi:hypothetical protein